MSYKQIGNEVQTGIAIAPVSSAATATTTGVVIDRKNYESAVFTAMTGLATGSPTTQPIVFTVQDCATSDGSFVTTGNTGTISADGTKVEINVDLNGENRYVKVVGVAAFTGGSTPTIPIAVSYTLGSSRIKPAV